MPSEERNVSLLQRARDHHVGVPLIEHLLGRHELDVQRHSLRLLDWSSPAPALDRREPNVHHPCLHLRLLDWSSPAPALDRREPNLHIRASTYDLDWSSPAPALDRREPNLQHPCLHLRLLQCLRLGEDRLGAADVEEGLLGHVVEVAVDERFEAFDALLDRYEDALQTGEDLAHEERLAQELLDLAPTPA